MRWQENGGSCTMRNFIICTYPQISLGRSSQGEWRGARGMCAERTENCTGFWWESPKKRDRSEDQASVEGWNQNGSLAWGVWIGFDWLRIGTGGGLLWVRWWTFGFLRHRVSLSKSSGPHNSEYEDDSLLWYCTSVTVVQLTWDYTAQWQTGVAVSIASGYRLDDQAIEAQSLAVARDFSSSLCVQTGSGAHPASCPVGTGGPFPGGNAQPGYDADHSPPSSADIVNE
jgi:hypothetical protein